MKEEVNRNSYETYDFTDTYTGVKSLDIKMETGKLVIKKGDEFKIEATGLIKGKFESYVKDNVWIIREYGTKYGFISDIFECIKRGFSPRKYSANITIYIPNKTTTDDFYISLGAGSGTVEDISTENLKVNVGAGELIMNNINSKKSDIRNGAGSVSINGTMLGHNNINGGVGKISLSLKGKYTNYNYSYNVGIGKISINDTKLSGAAGKGKINNNAKNDFYVECGIGNVNIEIKE